MRRLVLIAHDIRSCHNVGALLRTADGMGVERVYLTGYTPFPQQPDDKRLPHLAKKIDRQIHKTALGAENTIDWQYDADITALIPRLTGAGYTVAAVEQAASSMPLPDFMPPEKTALIVGNEVSGLDDAVISAVSTVLEVPMFGHKESFNVAATAAMVLYHCRFYGIN